MESSQLHFLNWRRFCFALVMCCVITGGEATAADVDSGGIRWVLTSEMRVLPVFPTDDIWKLIDTNEAGVGRRIQALLSDDKTLIPTHIALTLRYDPTEIWFERHSSGMTIHANLLTIEVTDEKSGLFKQNLEYPNIDQGNLRFRWEMIARDPGTNPIPSDADWRAFASSSIERLERQQQLWKGEVRPTIPDAQMKRTIDALKALGNANVRWKADTWYTYPKVEDGPSLMDIIDCGSAAIQPLIEMLDDPDKFAVAHVLLLQIVERNGNSRREFARSGVSLVVCDQLIVHLDEKTRNAKYPDSKQQQAWLRTFWSSPVTIPPAQSSR